jgi:hypothetical protein
VTLALAGQFGARRRGSRVAAVAASIVLACTAALGGCAASPSAVEHAAPASDAQSAITSFALLREAADHEALYTLAGGLKPMSTGIWRGSFEVDDPDLNELRSVRAALAPLRNEIWYADVQVFDHIHDGERSVHAFVVHRRALATMIDRFEAFWGPWGVTPCTHPAEVLAVVDRMPRADRWRGYGYLFGYPADAVDFFVEAGLAADDGREVGPGNDRRFVHVPTFAAETGRFTYAVPLDHAPSVADEALAAQADRILAAYADRRESMRDASRVLAELRRFNDRFRSGNAAAARVRDARHAEEGAHDAVLDAR